VKLSVSLRDEDVQFLDEYARAHARSRSGAVHEAIATLRRGTLADAYEQAFEGWEDSGEEHLWERASDDGLS
jgi:predicted transcriptional regulator